MCLSASSFDAGCKVLEKRIATSEHTSDEASSKAKKAGLAPLLELLKTEESLATVSVKIPDFSKKIDDLENKKKPINGPKFKVCGKEFYICVYPEDDRDDSPCIGVYLHNSTKEKIKISILIKHESGAKIDCKDQEICESEESCWWWSRCWPH